MVESRDPTESPDPSQEGGDDQAVIEVTGDPVYTLDRGGHFTFVNDSLARLVGRPVDDLVGEHASLVLDDSDVERGRELIAELLSSEANRGTYELELQTADGQRVPCENHIALLPSEGGFRGTVGVLRDISSRREREQALQRQVDRFESIFATVPEPLVHAVFDDEGRPLVQRVNPAFTDVFGFTTDELRGRSINEAIVPEGEYQEARAIDEQASAGDTVEREVQRMARDGLREFRLRVNWFTVDYQREAIAIYIDLTDEKRHRRELERQNARLDEFASVVSHDLRNPLNVVAGHLELLRESGDPDHLDAIDRATERMTDLIDDLLSLARAGETVEAFEPVDLETTVTRCWRNVPTADATVETVDARTVLADERRLYQLIENLFRNAVEHGGEDVTVTVGTTDRGFYVADDGPGIPPEDRERVFESGYSTAADGTGFGLRIVRSIADAHEWGVQVTESGTGGARIEVTGVQFASESG